MSDHLKSRSAAPDGFFEAEAAGLRWLAETGTVPVVEVLEQGSDHLRLEKLIEQNPNAEQARAFGSQLARLHDSGAPAFGWAPTEHAWFGPLEAPFQVPTTPRQSFAEYWSTDRCRRMAERCRPTLGKQRKIVDHAVDVIAGGAFDGICGRGTEAPARVHGDLWSGNVMWTARGGVLIDPAAHGGHRLEDLAMLSLFGAPHLEEIFAGYVAEHPMPEGWELDLPAHLFFGLLAHVVLFGGGYAARAVDTAERIIARAERLGA